MSLESNCVEKDESHKIFDIDRSKTAVTALILSHLLMKESVAIMSDGSYKAVISRTCI